MKTIAMMVVMGALAACGGSDDCKKTEVEVDYFKNHDVDHTQCKPIPASCGAVADCSAMPCARDLYNLCDSGYLGDGCSDTFPPTIISCQ